MYYGKTRATKKWLLEEACRKRARMTPAERVLWGWLQVRSDEWKSQAVKLQYILDFYNPFLCLAVEVDGGYHTEKHIITKDKMRDVHLLESGVFVFHVTNDQIFDGSAMPLIHTRVLRMVELRLRFGRLLGKHIATDKTLRYSEGI